MSKKTFLKRNFAGLLVLFFLIYSNIYSTMPPKPGDIEKYQKDGSLQNRIEFGEKNQTYKVNPALVERLKAKLEAQKQGKNFDEKSFPYGTGLPSKGTPRIFVLLIDFPDNPHTQSAATIQSNLFGDGNPDFYPYESLKNYYYRSSFGQLTIQGDVMPWWTAPLNRDNYTDDVRPLIKGALDAVKDSYDFTQYDNNGDGKIDYFICYWAGLDSGWNTTWWAWCDLGGGGFAGDSYNVDGKTLGVYSWVWEKDDGQGQPIFGARTSIHETGHGLGLPDYYDYDNKVGPKGGLGNMDMMDNALFDHNAFSKLLLDWNTTTALIGDRDVIHNITLRNADTFGDCVVIMPDAPNYLFEEYFIVQNRIRNGNDSAVGKTDPLPNEGLVIYHVDARLNNQSTTFAYDNSYTSLKLIRMMEADGKEEIEKNLGSNAGDFYTEGTSLSSVSVPDSNSYYYSNRNGTYITNISSGWTTRSATYINTTSTIFPDLIKVLDNTTEKFTTGGDSLWYGIIDNGAVNSNSAQSPSLSDGQESWIKMTVAGQGTITFDWKVSSQLNGDYFKFYVNDELKDYISGETNWESKSFRVTKSNAGNITFMWKYQKNSSGTSGQDRAWLDNVQFTPLIPSLEEALDNKSLVWSVGGDNGWYGQTSSYQFGGSSAKTDTITDSQNTWIKTQVANSGTLNYYWKTSSQLNADYLKFYIDGFSNEQISGGTDWISKSSFIKGNTNHTVMWKYQKDASVSQYSDCGYIDRVEFIPTDELSEAVDNNMYEFTTNTGAKKWVYQNYFSYYGGDAAQSGYTSNGSETDIQFYTSTPGYLSFAWKVSSELNHDFLYLIIDYSLALSISGEQDWATVNDLYVPNHTFITFRYVKDGSGISGYDCGWVDKVRFTPSSQNLSNAVDNHSLPLTTSADKPWAVDSLNYYYGGSAIKAGHYTDMYESSLQTTITGPGTMSFYWKCSTEGTWAPYTFTVDNVEQAEIDKIVDWQQVNYTFSHGTHTVIWKYKSYGDTYQCDDMVWLDRIQYTKNIGLNEAIDNSSLVLDTYGGGSIWYGVEDTSAYCGASARSGAIANDYSSFLETNVTGPRNLSFNWKVSSELNHDYLEFYINDVFKDRISGSTSWATKNYLLGAGNNKLSWQYYKDSSGSTGFDCGWIDKIKLTSTPNLAEALDFTGFIWNTDGNANWVGQTFTSYYDGDAAQSGPIGNGQYSRLYTSIVGPGLFSFYWKVSSHQGYAPLEFYIDGQKRNSISGEVDWQQKTYILESGSHNIEWKYSRNSAFVDGADCGWVDRPQWSPGAVPVCSIYVPNEYPTIQDAINAAREGCTIYIFPGIYYENLTISGKNIVLTSLNTDYKPIVEETIIDGNQQGPVITFGGDEYITCKVTGLTLRNGKAPSGGGILGNFTLATIEDNIITSNTATTECGGGIRDLSGTIQRNIISNNKSYFAGGGLFHCLGTIQNNFIYNNSTTKYGGGISWCNGAVQNNTIYGNVADLQGGGSFGSDTQLKNCIFWNNSSPEAPEIYYDTAYPPPVPLNCCIKNWTGPGTETVTTDPRFVNLNNYNFHIQRTSSCIHSGATIAGLTEDYDRDKRPITVYFEPRGSSHYDIGADEYRNTATTISITSPEGNNHSLAKTYEIQWNVSDTDYECSTSLYLAPDKNVNEGFLIVSGIKSNNLDMSYIFEKDKAPEGTFYLMGKISNGVHPPNYCHSPGTIKISRVTKDNLLSHLLHQSELPSNRLPFGDFNNDGKVDIADVVFLLKI